MFYYLEGRVAHTEQNLAVIDINGAGYACNTSVTSLAQLKVGERARLYTYLHIREDIFDIYGFFTQGELNCFKMLIGISGVGPKAAISILSVNTPERLALSVITGDEKALMQAQGIGKKLAQRIILELKDKMSKEQLSSASGAADSFLPVAGPGDKTGEAITALMVLGYSRSEAAMALRDIDIENLDIEDIIKQALRNIAKNI